MKERLGKLYNSPTYRCWNAMKNQCSNPKSLQYKNYGALGIKVCDRWLNSFMDFYRDMGERPDLNYTILRNDPKGDYTPDNCKWGLSENPGNKRHGHTGTAEFRIWAQMRQRCENPNHIAYDRYGGRGIKVCERWNDFELFLQDMGTRPNQRYSIDRIDNDKGYSPENCRWATDSEQMKNRKPFRKYSKNPDKRKTFWIVDGEKLGYMDIAERFNLNPKTVWSRLVQQGWTVEKTISTPARKLISKS